LVEVVVVVVLLLLLLRGGAGAEPEASLLTKLFHTSGFHKFVRTFCGVPLLNKG
jgi:hypothetical protein